VLKDRLKEVYPKKFGSLLKSHKPIALARIYFDFVRLIPEGYLIDSMDFQKDPQDVWSFIGEIYPSIEGGIEEGFKRQGSFANASISPVILNKVLGQKIVLKLTRKDS
ncbi:MAG: hypothetical protein HQL15_08345, partial [Candidatus Omnitrophica bacterium]|nr:hypothetical protein [Candidatus Omnitrophota bacterium]